MHRQDNNIIDLFRFTEVECRIFPFAANYMELVRSHLALSELDEDQQKRYAIVGLYLEFQATLHQGEKFDTDAKKWNVHDPTNRIIEKLNVLNSLIERRIGSTKEYISLIFNDKKISVDGTRLFEYVITGKKIQ